MAEISIAYRNGMVVAKPLSDDDEDEGPGRILTVEEFIDRLKNRTDIFGVDKNHRLRNSEVVALLIGFVGAFFMAAREPSLDSSRIPFKPDIPTQERDIRLSAVEIDRNLNKPTVIKRPTVDVEGRQVLRRGKSIATSNQLSKGNGGGSVRSRIASSAFFRNIAESMRGMDSERGEIFGKGGTSERLDAILQGKGGRAHGGMTSTGRKGYVPIGDGPGHFGSGYDGDGAGNPGDIFDKLLPSAESVLPSGYKTGPPDRIKVGGGARIDPGVSFRGEGRSKSDIMRVVLQNLSALRYAYSQRLRDRPGLAGRVTIRFAIDEFGRVIASEVISSSMNDQKLETIISGKILRWTFERIDKPGDITEVVYPFVFST